MNDNKGISQYQFFVFIGRIPPDQLVISLSGVKCLQHFYVNLFDRVHCLLHSTNLKCRKMITRIICPNNSRIIIIRRDQRYQTDFLMKIFPSRN